MMFPSFFDSGLMLRLKVMVNPEDVGDATRVKVDGPTLKEGRTQEDNTFRVDTKNAGYGGLSLSVEGPSKAEIKCKDNEDGTLDVSYKPTQVLIFR